MPSQKSARNSAIALRVYCFCCVPLLCTLSGFKLLTVASGKSFLDFPDPVFEFATIRQVTSLAAGLEAGTAIFFILTRSGQLLANCILWLSWLFLAYRTSMLILGKGMPCRCLGYLGDLTLLSSETLDLLALALLACRLVWSCLIKLRYRRVPSG